MVANLERRRGQSPSGGRVILGIDPGTATMGWGVIRQEGNRLSYLQHGAIVTPASWEMPRRLGRLFDGVTELVTGYRAGAEVAEYTPLQVKQAVTSYGRAEKRQVQEMVRSLLNLREIPKPDDAADGLAIAIAHAFSSRAGGRKGKVGVGK